jgi:hypothetical protein
MFIATPFTPVIKTAYLSQKYLGKSSGSLILICVYKAAVSRYIQNPKN